MELGFEPRHQAEVPETERLTAGLMNAVMGLPFYGSHEQALEVKHKQAFLFIC